MVNRRYHTPRALVENEMETLYLVATIRPIQEEFQSLYSQAYEYYQSLRGAIRISLPSFSFDSFIHIIFQDKLIEIKFGVKIKLKNNEYDQVTYYLAICDPDTKKIISYFHFDYAMPGSVKRNPKPIYHLQFADNLPPALTNEGYSLYSPLVDYPRILSLPISLALLLNLIFMEFYTEETKKIISQPEWNRLIRTNEELILSSYYRCCNEELADIQRHPDLCFINNRYYCHA